MSKATNIENPNGPDDQTRLKTPDPRPGPVLRSRSRSHGPGSTVRLGRPRVAHIDALVYLVYNIK